MTQNHPGKIGDIETLRAVGVVLVILQHWCYLPVFKQMSLVSWLSASINGGAGVDLFFVVSGFVISREFAAKMIAAREGGDAVGLMVGFWIRRAWRLLPSAWLWLLLCLVLSFFFNTSGAFMSAESNVGATLAGFLNVANLRYAETFGSGEYGASAVYWSLSLEEQFYLLFPLLLLVCGRFSVGVLVAVALYQLFSVRDLYMIAMRCDGLALGCILGMYSASTSILAPLSETSVVYRVTVLAVASMLLVSLALVGGSTYRVITHYWSLHSVIALVLVWIASHDQDLLTPARWSRGVMHYLGARSYALYLIHVPMLMALQECLHRYPDFNEWSVAHPLRLWTCLALCTLLLAELNYRIVEKPLRYRGREIAAKFQARRRPVVSGAMSHE